MLEDLLSPMRKQLCVVFASDLLASLLESGIVIHTDYMLILQAW